MTEKEFIIALHEGHGVKSNKLETDVNFMLNPHGGFSDTIDIKLNIDDCTFENMLGPCLHFKKAVVFENCIFQKDVNFHGAFFHETLLIQNSRFMGKVDFSSCSFMSSFSLIENIFNGFVNFIGSDFMEKVVFDKNEFSQGTNLIDTDTNRISFLSMPILQDNKGKMDLKLDQH